MCAHDAPYSLVLLHSTSVFEGILCFSSFFSFFLKFLCCYCYFFCRVYLRFCLEIQKFTRICRITFQHISIRSHKILYRHKSFVVHFVFLPFIFDRKNSVYFDSTSLFSFFHSINVTLQHGKKRTIANFYKVNLRECLIVLDILFDFVVHA